MSAGVSFSLFGIPVRIDPSFFLIAALLGLGGGTATFVATWVTVVFVSVLLHELGHAVAFRVYGQQPRILLQGMGGLTSGSGPLAPGRDIAVSLAGPLTGLVLLGLPAWWLQHSAGPASTWDTVLRAVVFVNVAWSGVNLLPVLPLDGGRVSASLLRRLRGADGERAAYVVSIAVAAAAGVYAYSLGYTFGALFALFFVAQNYSSLKQDRARTRQAPLVAGYQALVRNDLGTAVAEADRVLAGQPPPDVAASAVELKAWAGFCSGGAAAASSALAAMPAGVTTNGFLTGALALDAGRTTEGLDQVADAFRRSQWGPWSVIVAEAVARLGLVGELADRLQQAPGTGVEALASFQAHLHAAGRFPESAFVGQRAFDAGPERPAHVAYDVACSWARAGKPDDALGWLERAADAGLADPALLDADADLAPLRSTARYLAVRSRMVAAANQPPPPPAPPVL
ncbi:MAG: site-2 protease family protein [Acidimicrobiales bacterium]